MLDRLCLRPWHSPLVRVGLLAAAALLLSAGTGAAAIVPAPILAAAAEHPDGSFRVIIQSRTGSTAKVAGFVKHAIDAEPGGQKGITRKFVSIDGVAATLSGKQIVRLARDKKDGIMLVLDSPVTLTSAVSSRQQWPRVSRVTASWGLVGGDTSTMPTIAIVDSGIDTSLPDFGARVLESVNLSSLPDNSAGDGRGHGTFVAAIAAGAGYDYAGAAPAADLVSVDVIDDHGMALTSDVIAACDWILANKNRLDIRVANFSLHSAAMSTVFASPLNRAVERLWFAGVVVVTSAGNYGVAGSPQVVATAPGNDPFVITVGAADIKGTVPTRDDVAADWSVYGHTLDGFAKPELSAPGRYMVAPLPMSSTLAAERPDRMVEPGHFQLSGTSFAAPVVAGVAAYLLAVHPNWTPDEVKGALMLSARETPAAAPWSLGVGEVDAKAAARVLAPPKANAALAPFVVADPDGGSLPVFDAAAWQIVAQNDASWSNASWSNASWSNASWSNASWSNAAWDAASWATASWSNASWADGATADASWSNVSFADGASDDSLGDGGYWDNGEAVDDEAFDDEGVGDEGVDDEGVDDEGFGGEAADDEAAPSPEPESRLERRSR
jgi:serine protease AprX